MLDKEIKSISMKIAADNVDNREWCFWAESTCQTFEKLYTAGLIGSGIKVSHKKPKIMSIIHKYNRNINASGLSMEELIDRQMIDNLIHGFSVWRILKTKKEPYIDLGRLDAHNVMPISHPSRGWLKFIYKGYYDTQVPNTLTRFNSPNYSPSYDEYKQILDQTGTQYKWHIPRSSTLYFNLVDRPPMSSAMQYVIFKRWILWFMRKAAEKNWMPPLIGILGNNEIKFDFTPEDELKYMKSFAYRLAQLSTYGVAILKYGEDVKSLEARQVGRQSENLVEQIRLLDEQIMFSLGGVLGFQGVEKSQISGERYRETSMIRSIESNRKKIGNVLIPFYVNDLLPEYGYNIDIEELELDLSSVKTDRNLEIVQMVASLYEIRLVPPKVCYKILQTVWPWFDPEDKEMQKWADEQLKKEQEKMSRQQFGGGNLNALKKQTQTTRPVQQKAGAVQRRQ